jgi:DNA-binding CsgD family transcriptional regulator
MFRQKNQVSAEVDSKTYPLGEKTERADGVAAMALVALSHTPLERRLYAAMLDELALPASANPAQPLFSALLEEGLEVFTVRRVMELAGISSLSTIRRGLEGLVAKLSVEREPWTNGSNRKSRRDHGVAYRVFPPEEVIARRDQRGMKTFANGSESTARHHSFERVLQRVVEDRNLSRREGQVALCCAEGLTNAEIGARLLITEQTVKFHLRNIFVKFGVKRRAELISRLLM